MNRHRLCHRVGLNVGHIVGYRVRLNVGHRVGQSRPQGIPKCRTQRRP